MPGIHRLAVELGLPRKPIEAALTLLEREGLLVAHGQGRKRTISVPDDFTPPSLRVGFLMGEPGDRRADYVVELHHRMIETGHTTFYPPKSMSDLGWSVSRIARMVDRASADAWVVLAGSFEVLEWFSQRELPVLAIFGRRRNLPIASVGPDKAPAYADVTRRLVHLGHRRIVLLARRMRRLPLPGASERAFLRELETHGIRPSSYHLPDWEETPSGFNDCLESLFALTPPTALIIDEVPMFIAVQRYLSELGLAAPRDVSMVCLDPHPGSAWCRISTAHVNWDPQPVIRRIVRWANHVALGKEDRRQVFTRADFVEGGTVGPVPSGSG